MFDDNLSPSFFVRFCQSQNSIFPYLFNLYHFHTLSLNFFKIIHRFTDQVIIFFPLIQYIMASNAALFTSIKYRTGLINSPEK